MRSQKEEVVGNRLTLKGLLSSEMHWTRAIAEEVVARFPDRAVYTCAAGISPSGIVHFGNFRDVITAVGVAFGLRKLGKKTRVIFSWDDFDRLRKVPLGIPAEFSNYIGLPLSSVPDPDGKRESYARKFESEFEESMNLLGIDIEYVYQTKEYGSGRYDDLVIQALKKRTEIADLLLSFMTEKGKAEKEIKDADYREAFYPISVYSRFTGKDNTKVTSYDGGSSITYTCLDTGKSETIDIRKDHRVKLAWKVDWPMRWSKEGVVFEPGGRDHASPGGSYDVSSQLVKMVYEYEPPVFVGYDFVGITGLGSKMSGSKGNAISPMQLSEIYEPALLKWLYFRRLPTQAFTLAFDSEVYRQYEEYDRECERRRNAELSAYDAEALDLSHEHTPAAEKPIPFRQAVAFGQIVQWDAEKLEKLLRSLGLDYSSESIHSRIPRAHTWLERYNQDQMIRVGTSVNQAYVDTMSEEAKDKVRSLRTFLLGGVPPIEELEVKIYDIPKQPGATDKEKAMLQRMFFKDIYSLLIGSDTGPRLSTFLSLLPTEKVLMLLDI